MKIGIPRALLYYWFGHEWEDFWKSCGCEVVVSAPTDRQMMMDGAKTGLDELCLPMKIFLGHLIQLADQVDRIMIPHLIKVEANAYICPKFMGLPDVVAYTLPQLKSKLCIVRVGPKQTDQLTSLRQAALGLGFEPQQLPRKLSSRFAPSQTLLSDQQCGLEQPGKMRLGILGHPYCIYDSCFNADLLRLLAANGANFVTPEQTPKEFKGVGFGKLSKNLFWSLGRLQFDALEWMLTEAKVDGFIQIAPFACGIEAIIGDMLERRIKQAGKPLLKLFYEEHSGEAGVVTRVEAFLDLIRYRGLAC